MRNKYIYKKICNIEKVVTRLDKRLDKMEHKMVALSATVAMIVTILGWLWT